MNDLRVVTERLGGSPLAALGIAADPRGTGWFGVAPAGAAAWAARARDVGARFAGHDWLAALRPALGPAGPATDRLEGVARAGGVVVTTGQQPGLAGGPLYTLHKALTARALAAAIEDACGIPAAPLFWAATDDADIDEARRAAVAGPDGVEWLEGPVHGAEGDAMGVRTLGDVVAAVEAVVRAAGRAPDPVLVRALRESHVADATVGGAFVALLRELLGPLGIPVLDAFHPALRTAASPHLRRALERGEAVAASLRARDASLAAAGHEPQVREVPGLSLVFAIDGGHKRRIPLADAPRRAREASPDGLAANVLLRPLLESLLVPTVAYAAGPGETSYFAQVGAVASAMEAPAPLAVPRWSGTIVEPHVARMMATRGIALGELEDPHAAEAMRARTLVDPKVLAAFARLRACLDEELAAIAAAATPEVPARSVEGTRLQLHGRADRLERRFLAAARRNDTELVRIMRVVRGALRPGGLRQERALAWWPFVARHGEALVRQLAEATGAHAGRLIAGTRDQA
ncbi:MAG: bacillithiol biosynthesis BshC [Gemmatimonadetes bacterium]|nr:bacillithiol biosynthesis BshC [Gemmatimonadota bacterium]